MIAVHSEERRLGDYAGVVSSQVIQNLRSLAAPLAGLRVLHISASPFGTAVADTLASLVPLQRDLGILAEWKLLAPEPTDAGSAFYRGLSGTEAAWAGRERRRWLDALHASTSSCEDRPDVVIVHDPQALPLPRLWGSNGSRPKSIWHCHLDLSNLQPALCEELIESVDGYTAALFPAEGFKPAAVPLPRVAIAPPALDPLSGKNGYMSPADAASTATALGLDPTRPIMGQFAPIDERYGPVAAFGTYWLARKDLPGLQLVLVDNYPLWGLKRHPEVDRVLATAAGDTDIHIFDANAGLGLREINALERSVDVALQMAVPAGFGWGLAECQWKGKPAVAGQFGLLPSQVDRGRAGRVVEGAASAAEAAVELLQNDQLALVLGVRARRMIEGRHLITGLLETYLRLLSDVAAPARVSHPLPSYFAYQEA